MHLLLRRGYVRAINLYFLKAWVSCWWASGWWLTLFFKIRHKVAGMNALRNFGSGVCLVMGRSPRGRRRQFILAPRWERIARVRNRFRKGNTWLRFPSDEDGEPIVLCTKSLGLNHEVLTTYFTSFGLKSMNIKPLQREADMVTKKCSISNIYSFHRSELYIYNLMYFPAKANQNFVVETLGR